MPFDVSWVIEPTTKPGGAVDAVGAGSFEAHAQSVIAKGTSKKRRS